MMEGEAVHIPPEERHKRFVGLRWGRRAEQHLSRLGALSNQTACRRE